MNGIVWGQSTNCLSCHQFSMHEPALLLHEHIFNFYEPVAVKKKCLVLHKKTGKYFSGQFQLSNAPDTNVDQFICPFSYPIHSVNKLQAFYLNFV